jgi:hypothetical protein
MLMMLMLVMIYVFFRSWRWKTSVELTGFVASTVPQRVLIGSPSSAPAGATGTISGVSSSLRNEERQIPEGR